ncbi:minor tail protein [Mycobacterium phage FlagStaff]|uniref:Minor tail protein n=1 Tax=Mycobacterium phage FlagStaff TaxID=1647304 RepID=A0A0F6YQK4_9CAUD|nr:minor tail protein [Mycobacterium phage FlagStaff]AKF14458.1 minor tail protein [Mycobacterium phage FlagStaff]
MTAAEAPAAKKPFEKRYKTVVPVLLPAKMERPDTIEDLIGAEGEPSTMTARWLARESFEKLAAEDRLELVEYHERLIPPADIPPAVVEHLGDKPADAWLWFEFSGLGRLNQDMFDWFAAEFVARCDEWLAAERAYLTALDEHDDQE